MTLKEAAMWLGQHEKKVRRAIEIGVQLPKSEDTVKLKATKRRGAKGSFEIDEEDLEAFVRRFEEQEPGRHPPVAVLRALAVEARHKCGICQESLPLQYHHLIEWSKLKHHDPQHMLAVCGGCHSKIAAGIIDERAQLDYKAILVRQGSQPDSKNSLFSPLSRFTWEDIRDIIQALDDGNHVADALDLESSQYDFTEIDLSEKNRINGLSEEYFEIMRQYHEPSFGRVREFLSSPVNAAHKDKYFNVVDDLRTVLASKAEEFPHFDDVLVAIRENLFRDHPELREVRRHVNMLLSYMYVNCDIGRKAS